MQLPIWNEHKLILSLCDHSGAWSAPYRDAGYEVVQIDIKHGQDVRLFELPDCAVYGVLAAPPCTDFAVSGARWWADKSDEQLIESLSIVDACIRIAFLTRPKFWVLENPVGRLKNWIGEPVMYFNPCDYGGYPGGEEDNYTKRTGLWGRFDIPPQRPVEATDGSRMWRDYGGKSERTKMLRSITPTGFARAFFEANR